MSFYARIFQGTHEASLSRAAFIPHWLQGNNGKHPCDYDFQIIGQLNKVIAWVTSNECNLHRKFLAVSYRCMACGTAYVLKIAII